MKILKYLTNTQKKENAKMSADFIGQFENSVHKQRITIPTAFKKKFTIAAKSTIVATLGEKNSIAIYPMDNWNALCDKLKKGDSAQRKMLRFLRAFATPEQVLEGPGRIKLSEALLKNAKISKKAILQGNGDYISVWNPELFEIEREKLQNEMMNGFDPDMLNL